MKSIFLLAFALACNSDQTVAPPTPPLVSDAGPIAPSVATRTVGHRNPFGDVLQADNLMVDGDFELTGRSDQAPWIVFNQTQQTLNYDTGGRCRSGVRCAVIGTGDELIGYLASPALGNFEINVYVIPDTGNCSDATVVPFDVATGATGSSVHSLTQRVDVDGWCHFAGSAQNMAYQQPALLVEITTNAKAKSLHVDQASVLPVAETPVHPVTPPPMTPTSPEVAAHANTLAVWARTHRKFGRNVPRSQP